MRQGEAYLIVSKPENLYGRQQIFRSPGARPHELWGHYVGRPIEKLRPWVVIQEKIRSGSANIYDGRPYLDDVVEFESRKARLETFLVPGLTKSSAGMLLISFM